MEELRDMAGLHVDTGAVLVDERGKMFEVLETERSFTRLGIVRVYETKFRSRTHGTQKRYYRYGESRYVRPRFCFGTLMPSDKLEQRKKDWQQMKRQDLRSALWVHQSIEADAEKKIAMIRIDEELEKLGMQSKMLLQVHDELIFEGPKSELDELRALVKRIRTESSRASLPPPSYPPGMSPSERSAMQRYK